MFTLTYASNLGEEEIFILLWLLGIVVANIPPSDTSWLQGEPAAGQGVGRAGGPGVQGQ